MSSYRVPERVAPEPAPFLHPRAECPLCHVCPNHLLLHREDCPWWQA